jgi:hypothetical protein
MLHVLLLLHLNVNKKIILFFFRSFKFKKYIMPQLVLFAAAANPLLAAVRHLPSALALSLSS